MASEGEIAMSCVPLSDAKAGFLAGLLLGAAVMLFAVAVAYRVAAERRKRRLFR